MTEAVLDASVVLKWFGFEGEAKSAEARALRKQYEQGDLVVIVPSLLVCTEAEARKGGTRKSLRDR